MRHSTTDACSIHPQDHVHPASTLPSGNTIRTLCSLDISCLDVPLIVVQKQTPKSLQHTQFIAILVMPTNTLFRQYPVRLLQLTGQHFCRQPPRGFCV
jgi:hypothetical protein